MAPTLFGRPAAARHHWPSGSSHLVAPEAFGLCPGFGMFPANSTPTMTSPDHHAVPGSEPVDSMPRGACVLCGSRATTEQRGFSEYLGLPGHADARVRRCRACRMLFLDPYPDAAELEQLYSEAYFTGESGGALGLPGSHAEYADFARQRLGKFSATLELLSQLVPPPARLLDVGAATGEFLDLARRAGYEVAGIELSRFAAEQARARFGLDLFVGPLEAFAGGPAFDAIHLSHVLEHLTDPHRAIQRLRGLLSARGVVYVEVPFQWNVAERLHHFAGRRQPFNVFSVHHRLFFRPVTLRAMFVQHGFVCRHLTLTPPCRYPVETWRERAKWAVWRGLSLLGQGLFIEAVFSLDGKNRPQGG